MSESAAKRQPIDLDEFERRLRSAPPAQPSAQPAQAAGARPANKADPLAELARLVGGSPDPFAPLFQRGRSEPRLDARPEARLDARAQSGPANPPQPQTPQRQAPQFQAPQLQTPQFQAPQFQAPQPQAPQWPPQAPAARPPLSQPLQRARVPAEPPADLRGGFDEEEAAYAQAYSHDAHLSELPPRSRNDRNPFDNYDPARGGLWRRRSIVMGGGALLVLVGVAASLTLHGHIIGSGKPPTILADAQPYKVKPPVAPAHDQLENSTTLLDKGSQQNMNSAHVVDSEEQPVDLSTMGSQAGQASGDQSSAFAPRRTVKTVSVRPDGSIISQDDADASGGSAPSGQTGGATSSDTPTASTPSAVAQSDQNSGSSGSAPTSFAHVVDQAAANAASRPAPAVGGSPAAAAVPAPAQPVTQPRTPTRRVAALEPAAAPEKPTRTQAVKPSASAAGNWAVQLAAPGTPQEARAEQARLRHRFGAQIGSHALDMHLAQSGGRTVYRVRVGGLERTDAFSLCTKIKSAGGACFVAHD